MQLYPAAGEQKTVAEFLHSATVPFLSLVAALHAQIRQMSAIPLYIDKKQKEYQTSVDQQIVDSESVKQQNRG